MDSNTFSGIVRALAPTIVAFAVGKGWVNAGNADWIVAGVVGIGSAIWSWLSNRPAAVAAQAAAAGTAIPVAKTP